MSGVEEEAVWAVDPVEEAAERQQLAAGKLAEYDVQLRQRQRRVADVLLVEDFAEEGLRRLARHARADRLPSPLALAIEQIGDERL